MGVTRQNLIWEPTGFDPIDFHVTPSIVAAAAGFAAAGRTDGVFSPRRFNAASAAEAATVKASTVRIGDQIFRLDTRWLEELTDSGWRVVKTFKAIQYAPDWGAAHGMSLPTGAVSTWHYSVDDERVTVQGHIRWNNAPPTFTNEARGVLVAVPSAYPMRPVEENISVLGMAAAQIGGNRWMGTVGGVAYDYSGKALTTSNLYPSIRFLYDYANYENLRGAVPATWVTASELYVNFTYLV